MAEKETSWERVLGSGWEMIGKLGVVLALVGSAIFIYDRATRNTESVEVTGYFESYQVPPNLENMLVRLKDPILSPMNYRKIADYIKAEQKDPEISLNEEQIEYVSSLVEDMYKSLWDDDYTHRIQIYDSFVPLTIENTGSKTAEDVVLDLPAKGVALITNQDDSKKVVKFSKNIALDDLRPGSRTKISIWSEKRLGTLDEDEFRLSYANGVGEISFGRTVYGFLGFLDKYAWFVFISLLFMVSVANVIWLFLSTRRRLYDTGDSAQGAGEPNTSPNRKQE